MSLHVTSVGYARLVNAARHNTSNGGRASRRVNVRPSTPGRLSTAEAASALGLSRITLGEWRRKGILTAYYAGTDELAPFGGARNRKVEFDADAIAAFIRPPRKSPRAPRGGACQRKPEKEAMAIFFPDDDDGVKNVYGPAKRLCFSCPVRLECIRYAAQVGITEGFCGGSRPGKLTEFEQAWRLRGELPNVCHWCHENFLPSKGYSWLWCGVKCANEGEAAGGFDPVTPTATPFRCKKEPT